MRRAERIPGHVPPHPLRKRRARDRDPSAIAVSRHARFRPQDRRVRMTPRKKAASATPASPPATESIAINRAPVLTLWAAVVAERLGFDADEAATLGRAVAGLNAQSKGRRLGIFKPSEQ